MTFSRWKPIGFVDVVEYALPGQISHFQLPTPLVLDNKTVRVFAASRDDRQYSSVIALELSFVDVEQFSIRRPLTKPVLIPGELGFFDEHGVYPSSVVRYNNEYLMYYIGWNKGAEAPTFYASIGLARSADGLNFEKWSEAPLLSRSEHDPCLVTSPHVFCDSSGVWRMTYVSGIGWYRRPDGRLHSKYHIKSASGISPFAWQRNGDVAIPLKPDEDNIARSAVEQVDGKYRMWYSYTSRDTLKYRLGYAESDNFKNWRRIDGDDYLEIIPDFADEVVCYPSIFQLNNEKYMLFNGNNYGYYGFGIARWMGQ